MKDKAAVLDALRAQLTRELQVVQAAAAAAREGATHEEAKPENEYDTRALEQSYLAGAQTARAEALATAVSSLESFQPPALTDEDAIRVGAAVVVDDAEESRHYLLCDVGGGTKIDVDGTRWWVITPGSPLGRALIGKLAGDEVTRQVRGRAVTLEIVDVW